MGDLESGRVLGARCELIDILGRGRAGVVYRAYDAALGRVVAAKITSVDQRRSIESVAADARELRLRLDHPNLVTALDAFVDGPFSVSLTELFDFGDVDRLLPATPALGTWTGALLGDALAGLQVVHDRGVLHGDLHAGNILVTRDDAEGLRFALADFGTAGTAAEARGALGDAAPELREGRRPDARTDLFALGRVADRCARSGAAADSVRALIERLTAADPAQRPPSAEAALGALQALGPRRTHSIPELPELVPPLPDRWRPSRLGRPGRRADRSRSHPFVGRTEHLDDATRRWAAARGGRGSFTVVVGEAGAGKTSVVDEMVRRSNAAYVVEARAQPGALPLTLWRSFVEAAVDTLGADATAARLGPHLAALASFDTRLTIASPAEPTNDEQRVALGALIRELASDAPALLVFEDLHWADRADVETLVVLARTLEDAPVLVIATTRPMAEVEDAIETVAHRIELGPIPEDDLLRIAAAVTGRADPDDLDSIVRRSGGNAYFAVELSRALVADPTGALPTGIGEALEGRIAELGDETRRVLETLALVDGAAPLRVLATACSMELPAVSTCVARARASRLVRVHEGDDVVEFAHDLTRETLASHLDPAIARAHHRDIGETLLAEPGSDPSTLHRAARHLAAAGETARAFRAADEARARSEAVGDLDLLAAAGSLALTLSGTAAPQRTVGLAGELGAIEERQGRFDRAIAALDTGIDVATHALNRAELLRSKAYTLEKSGAYDESLATYAAAVAAVDGAGPGRDEATLRARVELGTGVTHFFRGDFEASRTHALRALASAEALAETELVAQACLQLEMVSSELGLADRERWGRRALSLLESSDDHVRLGNLLLNVGVSRYNDGAWPDALGCYRRAIDAFDAAHDVVGASIARNNEAEILTGQGRLREARWRLTGAQRIFTSTGYRMGEALATSGLSRVLLYSGRVADARRLLDRALGLFEELDAANFVYDTLVRRVELLLVAGQLDDARRADETATALESDVGSIAVVPITHCRLRGLLEWRDGDSARARRTMEAAETSARAADVRSELALTLHALVATELRVDDASRAETAALNEQLGVVWLPPPPA